MEPYNASIVRSQALASYSKMGIAIPMGDDALRVHLHTVDFVNTKFDVACYRKPPEGLETVSIDVQNETVYLDLNECADRWHLSKEKILDAYVKNGLSVYLRQKTRKFNVLDKIVEHYEAVSRCYEECSPNFLLSKGPEAAIFIQKKTLMKIISLFHKKLESSHPGRSFRIHFSEKAITKYEAMNFSEILCFGTADHEYYLINEPMKTKLLSGSFGNVFKAQNIGIGKFAAIKEARMDYTEEEDGQVEERKAMANKGILAEINNLRMLKQLNLTENIQAPPFFSYRMTSPEIKSSRLCFAGHFYNKQDLFSLATSITPRSERLKILCPLFAPLISALSRAHDHNIVVSDIKPENIFVEINNQGTLIACFGDLAGLRQIRDGKEKHPIFMHSPSYSPYYPPDSELELWELQAYDLFQLGSTFYTLITGIPPYLANPNSEDEYADFSLEFNEDLLLKVCSVQGASLLRKMCFPDPILRLKAKEAASLALDPTFTWLR